MVRRLLLDGVLFASPWLPDKHPRDARGHFRNVLAAGDDQTKALLRTSHEDDLSRNVAADRLEDVGRSEEASLLRGDHPALVLGGSVLRLHGDLAVDGSAHVARRPHAFQLTVRHGGHTSTFTVPHHRGKPAWRILARLFALQQSADTPVVHLSDKEEASLLRAIGRGPAWLRDGKEPQNLYPDSSHPSSENGDEASYFDGEGRRRRDDVLRRARAGLHVGYEWMARSYMARNDYHGISRLLAPNARERARFVRREQQRLGIPLRPDGLPVFRLAPLFSMNDSAATHTEWNALRARISQSSRPSAYFHGYGETWSFDENVRDGMGGWGFPDKETLDYWVRQARDLGLAVHGYSD